MKNLDQAIEKLKEQLDWIGPNEKVMGHVVLPRELAHVVLAASILAKRRTGQPFDPHDDAWPWLDIASAPKDGSTIRVPMPARSLEVYWCKDLEKWVTVREYTINSFVDAQGWQPA